MSCFDYYFSEMFHASFLVLAFCLRILLWHSYDSVLSKDSFLAFCLRILLWDSALGFCSGILSYASARALYHRILLWHSVLAFCLKILLWYSVFGFCSGTLSYDSVLAFCLTLLLLLHPLHYFFFQLTRRPSKFYVSNSNANKSLISRCTLPL